MCGCVHVFMYGICGTGIRITYLYSYNNIWLHMKWNEIYITYLFIYVGKWVCDMGVITSQLNQANSSVAIERLHILTVDLSICLKLGVYVVYS